jgi:hypothetical protein
MSSTESVTRWISRIKEGDRGGVKKLLDHYFQRLAQLARKKLQTLPRLTA